MMPWYVALKPETEEQVTTHFRTGVNSSKSVLYVRTNPDDQIHKKTEGRKNDLKTEKMNCTVFDLMFGPIFI